MTTSAVAAAPSAMQRFFNSCFKKRQGSGSRPKSPHIETTSTETDGSDATPAPRRPLHAPKSPKDRPDIPSAEASAPPEQASVTQDAAMPKAVKKSTPKSAKDKKPYLKVQQVSRFYSDSANGPPNVDQALEAMFDSLATETSKDELDMDGTIAYCQALNVDPASYEFFVLADIVQVQSFGQITRQGFVKGWKRVWEESREKEGARQQEAPRRKGDLRKGKDDPQATTVSPDMDAHQQYVQSQIRLVKTDAAVFRKVYRSAFVACKEAGKRELDMGEALTYWEVLFEPTMHGWATANVEWLEAWKGYLTEKFWVDKGGARKWTRSVSRDLWNQILLFAERTMADETLGFWSEDQAWPGLIDEFVVWCKEKGIVKAQNEETMELEE